MSSPTYIQLNAVNEKQFTFKSSRDQSEQHQGRWCLFVVLLIIGVIIEVFLWRIVGSLLCLFAIVMICVFCVMENMKCPTIATVHRIGFNAVSCTVNIYSDGRLCHTFPYNKFKHLRFDHSEQTHTYFYWFCCRIETYLGGVVSAVLQNGQHIRINTFFCVGEEFQSAVEMVKTANQYWGANKFNVMRVENVLVDEGRLSESSEWEQFEIGSCCYVDCDSVYGVVIGFMKNGDYKIIDLFEKRERFAAETSLTIIKDINIINQVVKQYDEYLLNHAQN